MLQALADDAGLSSSDIVRQLIRAAYKDKFGDKKPKLKG
ncbi:MAG: ribbon-helix-helix protein, CopG family [Polyangiaceae bacterium]|nr:ribbon-helix-helix protein, CopG family [Polyangiaceae bacterium]